MKKSIILLLGVALICTFAVFMSCDKDQAPITGPQTMDASAPKLALDVPTINCINATETTITLQITAGASGAPYGFSVQWVKLEDYPMLECGATGGTGPQHDLWGGYVVDPCAVSLSGVPGCSYFNLPANSSVTIDIGSLDDKICGLSLSSCGASALLCGTDYVFRAFAHGGSAWNRSPYTGNLCCFTEDCGGYVCGYSQGYYTQQHQYEIIPLTIGGREYSHDELLSTLERAVGGPNSGCAPGQGDNSLVKLAHQLITTMLNEAQHNSSPPPDCDVDAANAMLNGYDITTDVACNDVNMEAAAACLQAWIVENHCP
jgi:hypothetical protein